MKKIFLIILLFTGFVSQGQTPMRMLAKHVSIFVPPTPIISDNFETGSAVGWTSNGGTVNTYATFGITAPTGGGTYGLQMTSTNNLKYSVTGSYTEVWMTGRFRSGATASTRTHCSDVSSSTGGSIAWVRFSNSASPKVEVVNVILSTTYTGTNTFSASTWYKIKMRVVVSATVGIIQVWVDAGAGYVLEINQSGINTGSSAINRLYVGSGAGTAGQTGYIDNIGFYTSNPD